MVWGQQRPRECLYLTTQLSDVIEGRACAWGDARGPCDSYWVHQPGCSLQWLSPACRLPRMTNEGGEGRPLQPSLGMGLCPLVLCPNLGNNATLLLPPLFQNGSKDNSLDMLGTDIWAANTFDSFR